MEKYLENSLVMPSSFTVMDEDEMCYIDGGIHWKRSYVAKGIDIAIIIASAGLSSSARLSKFAAKIGWKALKKKAKSALVKFGVKAALAKTACDILTTLTDFTPGNAIAYAVDKVDKSGLNGYVDF